MKNIKNRIISGLGAAIAGLLIILGPVYIFKICGPMENGGWMKCHWTAQAEIGIGVLLIAVGVLFVVFSSPQIRFGLSISAVLSGILILLYPSVLIGGCGMGTMPCRSVTFPAFNIIGVITVIGFAVNLVYLYKTGLSKRDK